MRSESMSNLELNLRLDVRGRSSTAAEIAQRHARALALLGDCEHRRHDTVVGGELVPRLVARLEGWDAAGVYDLAERLEQDCIAALDIATGAGSLIGPRVEGYGAFDLALFQRLSVEQVQVDPAPNSTSQSQADLDALNADKKDMAEAFGFGWDPPAKG